ncbi:MAG: PAS domain-containing protein, partial [Nitrospirae bacterium]|nr:PAS domain-containing protein [Nitrospirota bacterium]
MTETNIERKARKSIIIYSALGIFLIGTIVFLVSIIPLYSRLKGGVQSNLVHAAKVRSMAVDEYILRAKDITLQVTSRTLMRKKLEAYNRGEITLEELIELTKDKLSDAMKLSEDVAGISRISTKGKLLLEVGLPLPERDLWPIPPENSREVTVYGPISMGGETYILVAAHIFGERATKAGTDIVIFKTDRLWLILHDRTGLGETGEVVLGVSKYGQTQLFSPMGEEKGFIIKSAMENSFQKKSGIMTSEDSYDKRVIIAYCPVQGAKWGIAVKMDAAELYSPINRQVILIFGIIAVLILAGTLGTVLLLRPLTDALHRELTDRRLAENALRESSELLEKVFSNTHLMIAYMDAAFNFIRVNRAYAEADGREPEFFAGRNHFELYPNEENRQIFQNVVDTGEPCFAYEKPFEYAKHPERGVTYWDWSLQPVKEAGGKVTGLVFTLLNVTERRRMED